MADLLSQYIFKKDFTTAGYKIYIRNETSHTIFSKAELIHLRELKEDGLVIELPVNVCQKGHSLTLFFLHSDAELISKIPDSGHFKEALFEFIVKVEKLEPNKLNKASVFAVLHFTQHNVEQWKKILSSYSDNQDEINDFLSKQHKIRDEE